MTQTDLKTPQGDQLLGGILMKAMIFTNTTRCLQLTRGFQTNPKDDEEVLDKNISDGPVTAADCELRSLKFPIWLRLPIRIYLNLIRQRTESSDRS